MVEKEVSKDQQIARSLKRTLIVSLGRSRRTLRKKAKVSYMTLREFYMTVIKEFNDGKPLEYKFTEPGGYYRLTKGFDGHGLKEMKASQWLKMIELCKHDVAKEHENDVRSRGRPTKKVRNKYVGDLYE